MLSIADLYEGARMSSMHHLSDLAKKMESRYTLKDLVLPEKQAGEVDALIAMARNRSLVLDDMGVGKKLVSGRGISGLFTGVPGTGKTLAAQAIAGELGLEIYRVDLSTIISKYIGETEKNLERIFTEAQNSNVVLFFDEADSLFGRRSEVSDSHDRYANIEVGYLLQRIETYDGIVLMATNLGANLDEAFARLSISLSISPSRMKISACVSGSSCFRKISKRNRISICGPSPPLTKSRAAGSATRWSGRSMKQRGITVRLTGTICFTVSNGNIKKWARYLSR